ncbi:MAG: polysaccharide ABC transporter ATP-binding protein [Flavobacteriales bacterium]|nr:polysaccharide ABC transporter ATP-binding protein [Flavobacteriales bacterium]
MKDIAIKLTDVSKRYTIGKERDENLRSALSSVFTKRTKKGEKFWALKDLSFEVERGQVVGIIGRNGAGKSTLLKILSHITRPTQGQIEIIGRVASLLEVGTGFHAELTGRENVFLNGTILGMTRKEVQRKFDEIVAFSGIAKFIDTPVKHYSSGMYVRLAFAVAAHLEPEILIIDEVLAVGDAEFQKKCLGKMKDVAGEGRTVLFVSHDLTAVKTLCNRGLLLQNGRLVCDGNIETVIAKYNTVFNDLQEDYDLSNYQDRSRGNKFAYIDRVILNKSVLAPKDTLRIDVRMTVLEASILGNPIDISIFIFDEFQTCIYHLNSKAVEKKYFEKLSETVVIEINNIALAQGSYWLNVHLGSGLVEYDYVESIIPIKIETNDFFDEAYPFIGKVFKEFKVI